ncbi:ETEC_3214 domain-containing protein [Williamsia deligens]|uniref:ETEC_3214 domain-containing protein n=1 Tax=Williamsia deligens TaxID=321325 RepID=A0ABW3G6U8_9NOCA|nr:ETEC_3214 domain-containing protein [Williamsia deligens]MCP2193397.1 hypothetical protein [Williamsia deligens]
MTALAYLVYASAGITIIGATPSAIRAAFWVGQRTTAGRRRQLQHTLDRLACGSTREFVDELLGPPMFVNRVDDRPQQIHRLDGAWVAVELIDGVVLAFSITITNRDLAYPIDAQTHQLMRGHLGRDSFAQLRDSVGKPLESASQFFWMGAYRWYYNESYYGGRPGAYQTYWLSQNMAGAAGFHAGSYETFATGSYEHHPLADIDGHARAAASPPPDRSSLTANTLTVMNSDIRPIPIDEEVPHSNSYSDQFFARSVLGTDSETLRLDATRFRPPTSRPVHRFLAATRRRAPISRE